MAIQQSAQQAPDEIDLSEVVRLLWRGRYVLVAFALFFAVLGVGIALYLPNEYRSEATFKPAGAEENELNGGLLAQVGALAGFNIGMMGSANANLSVAMLRSQPFIVDFARRHNIVVDLIAGKRWDPARNQLLLDTDLYDPRTRRWVRQVDPPLTPEPVDDEIFRKFEEILSIEQDPETGFVNVAITFLSPVLAQQWLEKMIADLNEQLRRRDIIMRERSISYLTTKLAENRISGLDSELSELLQSEIRDHMLAKVRLEYALETVSRPYRPIFKWGPNRALIAVVSTLAGALLGVIALFILSSLKPTWFR